MKNEHLIVAVYEDPRDMASACYTAALMKFKNSCQKTTFRTKYSMHPTFGLVLYYKTTSYYSNYMNRFLSILKLFDMLFAFDDNVTLVP